MNTLEDYFPAIMGKDPGDVYDGIDREVVAVWASETLRTGSRRPSRAVGDVSPSWSAVIRAYENVGE